MSNSDLFMVGDLAPDKSNKYPAKRNSKFSEINQRKPSEVNQPVVKLVRYDPEDPTEIEGFFDDSNRVVAKLKR